MRTDAAACLTSELDSILPDEVVGEVRVELTWVSPTDFKSVASAIPPLARDRGLL